MRHLSGCVAVLAVTVAAMSPLAVQPARHGAVVRGRIVDPHGLRTPETGLVLWYQTRPYASSGDPVPIGADGTFVSPALLPGTYVLEAKRSPSSFGSADLLGLEVVDVGAADVSEVTIALRRPSVVTGRYRMESDDAKAAWPQRMHVLANLALEGLDLGTTSVTEGGPDGTFVLRNAFGPRILKFGHAQGPAAEAWWPSRVLLDGQDITNVPTDFSRHESSRLEFVFTQHPPRISGTVTDAEGRPVSLPWVLVVGTDRAGTQPWSASAFTQRGDLAGRFSIVVTAGQYRVHALPGATFPSIEVARYGLSRVAFGGTPVSLQPREQKRVALTLQPR
jgi:hypothetical protein